MEKAKVLKKVDITGTLRNMPVNSDIEFKTSEFDVTSIRTIACRLNKSEGTFAVKKESTRILVTRSL
jgi:hypothetical protein